MTSSSLRLVFISDTHNHHMEVPDGDLLFHSGDLSEAGTESQIAQFAEWFSELPHKHKVFIAGNHDFLFEKKPQEARELVKGLTYLEDQKIEIEGLKIYGSPWQPLFHHWAFNLERGTPLKEKWDLIPTDTDILLTHGPPFKVLDKVYDGRGVGCEELIKRVAEVKPLIHAFGHIHEAYGMAEKKWNEQEKTLFLNASSCNLRYHAVNPAWVIDVKCCENRWIIDRV